MSVLSFQPSRNHAPSPGSHEEGGETERGFGEASQLRGLLKTLSLRRVLLHPPPPCPRRGLL